MRRIVTIEITDTSVYVEVKNPEGHRDYQLEAFASLTDEKAARFAYELGKVIGPALLDMPGTKGGEQ